ncbi:Uncharacterised protein [Salmonella sp. NCTC 11881]|nr:Uncharacterised protein [Salmonella sp. NCTC 11881]
MLRDESLQQIVHATHHLSIAVDFIRTISFNGAYPDLLHVPRDNTGEGAPQIRRQNLNRLIRVQFSGWPYSHATAQTAPADPVQYASTS